VFRIRLGLALLIPDSRTDLGSTHVLNVDLLSRYVPKVKIMWYNLKTLAFFNLNEHFPTLDRSNIQNPELVQPVLWIRIAFNAEPDPAFYPNADTDPYPGSQNNADPVGSESWSDFWVTKSWYYTKNIL